MTKALLCTACMDIRGLHPSGKWTSCRCGTTVARWLDPMAGSVRVLRIVPRERPEDAPQRIIGLNNRFLVHAGDHRQGLHEDWRKWHEEATKAPGYIFDASKRGCWAAIIPIGFTDDIAWETDENMLAQAVEVARSQRESG